MQFYFNYQPNFGTVAHSRATVLISLLSLIVKQNFFENIVTLCMIFMIVSMEAKMRRLCFQWGENLTMTERELRQLISRSREEGFRALFQQYQGYVYTIVWNHISSVGSREDAEECMSDIFTEIFLHFEEIHENALKGYIGTVAKRKSVNLFYQLQKNQTVPLEEAVPIASGQDIPKDYENADFQRNLLEKIISLGEPDSTIIIQKYYYDRKSGEIAKVVNLSPVTVRVRLNRALKRLRKLLTDEEI